MKATRKRKRKKQITQKVLAIRQQTLNSNSRGQKTVKNVFKVLRKNNSQTRIVFPAQSSLKSKWKIDIF